VGAANLRMYEKAVMLQILDQHWKEHLAAMDYLRQGIHLRGYAQKNPKQEYKREAFEMFGRMLDSIKHDVVAILSKLRIERPEAMAIPEREQRAEQFQFKHEEFKGFSTGAIRGRSPTRRGSRGPPPFVRADRKVGATNPALRLRQEIQAVLRAAQLKIRGRIFNFIVPTLRVGMQRGTLRVP
jgi:preprotein translocase subunit SecA